MENETLYVFAIGLVQTLKDRFTTTTKPSRRAENLCQVYCYRLTCTVPVSRLLHG